MRYRKVEFGLDTDAARDIYPIKQSRYPWLGVNGRSPVTGPQVNFRIDPKLKAEAEKAAAEDHRSLSSLIEKLLSDYVKKRRGQ
jgi:hypothetical protein